MAAVAQAIKGGNELEQAAAKALNKDEEAPKRKHVRSICNRTSRALHSISAFIFA